MEAHPFLSPFSNGNTGERLCAMRSEIQNVPLFFLRLYNFHLNEFSVKFNYSFDFIKFIFFCGSLTTKNNLDTKLPYPLTEMMFCFYSRRETKYKQKTHKTHTNT